MTLEFLTTAPFFNAAPAIARAQFSQVNHAEARDAIEQGRAVVGLNKDGSTHLLSTNDKLPEYVAIQNFN